MVVFDSSEDYFWLIITSAYGAAVTIAGATLIINIVQSKKYETEFYFREDACWLQPNYDWAFKGPVLLILVVNTAILALGLYKSYAVSKNDPLQIVHCSPVNRPAIFVRKKWRNWRDLIDWPINRVSD